MRFTDRDTVEKYELELGLTESGKGRWKDGYIYVLGVFGSIFQTARYLMVHLNILATLFLSSTAPVLS